MSQAVQAFLQRSVRLWRDAAGHFLADDCRQHAAALTFTTLFAIVPLLTVVFTALSVVPSTRHLTQDVQAFIFSNLLPSSGEKVAGYLEQFAQQASQLTLVGVAMLVVTAVLMLVTIERAFNAIWQVRAPRQSLYSLLRYWAVISLGPFLLGAGFFVSSYLTSLRLLKDTADVVGSVLPGVSLVPLLFTALGFTLIYVAVPNCRVPPRAGLIAGIAAAVLFELAKRGFGLFVTHAGSYQLVYGAFAAFPLFLLWIYVSWLIVLFGVELSRALVLADAARQPARPPLAAVLDLLALLQARHAAGQGVTEVEAMTVLQRAPVWGWAAWKDWLQTRRLIVRSAEGDFTLGRDLQGIHLGWLCRELPFPLPRADELALNGPEPVWLPGLRDWLAPAHAALAQADAPSLAALARPRELT